MFKIIKVVDNEIIDNYEGNYSTKDLAIKALTHDYAEFITDFIRRDRASQTFRCSENYMQYIFK